MERKKQEKDKKKKSKLSVNVKFTILAVILITIFCISISPVTMQNDTYYTIEIGKHIINNGIDMQDPFSWHENLPYTYPHWLYDVLNYLIYSIFGMTGIYITTCVLSVILGNLVYLVNCKLAKNKALSFIITIGVMYLIRGFIAARAQLVTFILFVLTILFIEKFLESKKKRYVFGLIIIPILIANLHVAVFPFYFVLYLPYIGEYLLAVFSEYIIYRKAKIRKTKRKISKLYVKNGKENIIQKLEKELKQIEEKVSKIKIKRSKELQNPYKIKMVKNNNVKWLILIVIICLFTGFLTPLGTTPYTYLVKTMQGNTTQNISEHQPTVLANDQEAICTIIFFLVALIFTKTKIRLSDLFMLGGLSYLMIMSHRQISIFALVCSVILNKLTMGINDNIKQSVKTMEEKMTTIVGIILTCVVIVGFSYYMVKDKFDDKYIDESSYPVKACDFILENIDLGTAKFYNEYNYGSYMLFRGIPVFIDSRADLYDPKFSGKENDIFMDFIETSGIGKFYEDIFEKYGITHVITFENSKMNMIITKTKDPKYKQLYKDKRFVVYERVK